MSKLIAICGLDCEKCLARIATINDDQTLREKVALEWSKLNDIEIKPDMINCLGCRLEGPKTYYCDQLCPIRQCALIRHKETCGDCKDMKACSHLNILTKHNKEVLKNLHQLQLDKDN